MFNFEKRISEITPDAEYLQNPVKTNNRMSIKDLHTMSMNIPWLEILKAAFSDAPMSEETEVMVVSPQYAADIAVILSTTDRGSLNNYLMWRLVQSYMPYLSKTFREVADLYRKSLTGAQKPLERWEFCARTTEAFFGHLMNSMFARELGPDMRERRPVVKKIFDYIKHNVAKAISVSSGYDYAARRTALTKLKNMTVEVGTPDFLADRQYLKVMFNPLMVQKTDFFQNIQYGLLYLRKREELALVSPAEEMRWMNHLNSARVMYVPSANKVVVPESMLSPPLFSTRYPNAVNFGGLGVSLAEAVMEGVIGHGLLFDSNGRLQVMSGVVEAASSHMLTQPLQAFDAAANCLSERWVHAGIDTPDFVAKCKRRSAMAVVALKQTLVSLEDILEIESASVLPAMETFDPQTVFFLSYAQSMCAQQTFKQRDIDRTSGDALLPQELLRGALAETREFQHFFYCSRSTSESGCNVL
jgi:endothelin-converting enzyme